jgi:predicted Zn-dependent protease
MQKLPIIALLLAALTGCATSTPVRMWDIALIPSGASEQIRLRYLDQAGKEHTGGYVERAHVDQLRDVVAKIAAVASQRVDKVMVSDQEQANASAGFDKSSQALVVVTAKMLDLVGNDRDAMAALIGHEVSHLALRHGEERKQQAQAAAVIGTIAGVLLQVARIPLGNTIADVGTRAVVTAYSRDQERDADRSGIQYAYDAGFDPDGAVRLFALLAQANSASPIPFLSTHPVSDERIANLAAIAKELKSKQ